MDDSTGQLVPSDLVFRPASIATHHDDAGHELADHVDQIGLCCHHVVDVFVGSRNFIQTTGQQANVFLVQVRLPLFPAELFLWPSYATCIVRLREKPNLSWPRCLCRERRSMSLPCYPESHRPPLLQLESLLFDGRTATDHHALPAKRSCGDSQSLPKTVHRPVESRCR